jgi:hypothetical protein
MSTRPLLSIVLPYYERPKEIALIASQLAIANVRSLYPHLEVVFVDDGSVQYPITELPDDVLADVESLGEIYTLQPHALPRTATQAWNVGLELSRGRWVMLSQTDIDFLNYDVIISLMNHLNNAPQDAWHVIPTFCTSKARWLTGPHQEWDKVWPGIMPKAIACPFTAEHNMPFFVVAIPAWWLKKVGGVDPAYKDGYGYEDIDLTLQSVRDGLQHVVHTELCTVHRAPTSVWGIAPSHKALFTRNLDILLAKWLGARLA